MNDFDILFKGIRLIACPSPSFFTYGNNRGVRIITLDESQPENLTTKVIHYDGYKKEKPLNPLVKRFGIQTYEGKIRPLICGGIAVATAAVLSIKKVVKK